MGRITGRITDKEEIINRILFVKIPDAENVCTNDHTTSLQICAFLPNINTRNNIVFRLARRCLCYCKTFSLVPDPTVCTEVFFTEVCSTLFVPPETK